MRLPGITGVVRDGILPGLYGYEAGQVAVGDMLAWFLETLAPPGAALADLEQQAGGIGPGETGLLALTLKGAAIASPAPCRRGCTSCHFQTCGMPAGSGSI